MIDIFVMFAIIVAGCGGFVVLYLAWIYIIAKISKITFSEALTWWDD